MQEDLETHKLDIVLNNLPFQSSREEGLENFLIAQIPIFFCCNRSRAAKFRSIPSSLNDAPLILPTAQSQTYHALQEYFMSEKIKPHIIAEIQDVAVSRRLALSGKEIVPLNRFTVPLAPAKDKLIILSLSVKIPVHDTIYLTRKKRQCPHPVATLVLEKFRLF